MTTHRIIQLWDLADNLSAISSIYHERAKKAISIGNEKATLFFQTKAWKAESVFVHVKWRLEKAGIE